jgi:hypothetical protein
LNSPTCLPDILWKARLGPFIQQHREFPQLRKASTTRSAKKSNEGFVRIATTILSLEMLASSFAGWSAIYPEAGSMAQAILKRNARGSHMPLMEFYLYPPKYISSAAIATVVPPPNKFGAVDLPGASDLLRVFCWRLNIQPHKATSYKHHQSDHTLSLFLFLLPPSHIDFLYGYKHTRVA